MSSITIIAVGAAILIAQSFIGNAVNASPELTAANRSLAELRKAPDTNTTRVFTARGPDLTIPQLEKKWGVIPFYLDRKNSHSGFLGNFHHVSVTFNGLTYKCSEAAYQAQKFPASLRKQFTTLSGGDAWRLAQKMKAQVRKDWNQRSSTPGYEVKDLIMLGVLREKFKNTQLQTQLLSTGSYPLVEHIPRSESHPDYHWGDGGDGHGKNMLGKLLMRVRGEHGGTGIVPLPGNYSSYAGKIW